MQARQQLLPSPRFHSLPSTISSQPSGPHVPTFVCNPNFVTCPNASKTTDANVSPAPPIPPFPLPTPFHLSTPQVPTSVCNPNFVTCPDASETTDADVSPAWVAWGNNSTLETTCFEGDGTFNFGIYHMALQLMKDSSAMAKIFYGLFFGIMTLRCGVCYI
ncbi:unnamed protein product [Closterium sp. NIES-54]